jgi:glycosyltransferase involved in cell wall biosynthesis
MAQRIRVLFAIDDMSGGGSQRQMISILERLDREQFEPYLYLTATEGELLAEVPRDVPIYIFGKRRRRRTWWFPGQYFAARARDVASVLNEHQIDVVYDRTYHMTLVAARATRRRPTPRLSVIVADPQRDFAGNAEWFRGIKQRLLRRAYQTADRVLAVSEGVRKAAVSHYDLPPEKTLTMHNLFDVEKIDRLITEPLPDHEARGNEDQFEIVAAGRLHPQKGFEFLLEAIHDLVHKRGRYQTRLRILGTGPLQAALEKYIAEHALKACVTLVGYRNNPLPYYRQADLFVLSSLYEGMPNALVEAMLCRVPVLATDCPSGPAEILYGGRLGRLVAAADAKQLADAMEDAMLHPDRWKGRATAARSHIEKSFSAEAGITRLQSLLAMVAPKRDGSENI